MSTYTEAIAELGSKMCTKCGGQGEIDDAAPGDICFRKWPCPACKGSGWADELEYGISALGKFTINSRKNYDSRAAMDAKIIADSVDQDTLISLLSQGQEKLHSELVMYSGGIKECLQLIAKLGKSLRTSDDEAHELAIDQLTEAMQRWGWQHCDDGPALIEQIDTILDWNERLVSHAAVIGIDLRDDPNDVDYSNDSWRGLPPQLQDAIEAEEKRIIDEREEEEDDFKLVSPEEFIEAIQEETAKMRVEKLEAGISDVLQTLFPCAERVKLQLLMNPDMMEVDVKTDDT